MDRLIEGYHAFRQSYLPTHRTMFNALAHGQAPKAMVIACCDSRVDPNLIFNAQPGEIFTLRNVASLVPPYSPDDSYHGTSSAIEFAVRSLNVPHIIVMGHSRCGGVRALLGAHEGEFIGPWMRIAEGALTRSVASHGDAPPDVLQQVCEHEAVKTSLGNLRGFPWISERLREGKIALHGCYFDIETGELQRLNEETGAFSVF